MIPPISSFQAKWEEPLRPSKCCTWQSVAQTIFFAIAAIVRRILLPAAWISPRHKQAAKIYFEEMSTRLQEHFTLERAAVVTPDGARLQAIFFRSRLADPNTPTVIYFNPNAVLADECVYNHLLFNSIRRRIPCNVVAFDYRGVGKSTGSFKTIGDLVVDGASIVQWVKEKIGTPAESQIHFYGRSLGAIIATQVKALNPAKTPGRLVNERSGSSMDDYVEVQLASRFRILRVFKTILRWLGLSFDAASSFRSLVGKKMVVYHPGDGIFPYAASLAHRVRDTEHEVVELEEEELFNIDPHNIPLHDCLDRATQRSALEPIHNFLFARA